VTGNVIDWPLPNKILGSATVGDANKIPLFSLKMEWLARSIGIPGELPITGPEQLKNIERN